MSAAYRFNEKNHTKTNYWQKTRTMCFLDSYNSLLWCSAGYRCCYCCCCSYFCFFFFFFLSYSHIHTIWISKRCSGIEYASTRTHAHPDKTNPSMWIHATILSMLCVDNMYAMIFLMCLNLFGTFLSVKVGMKWKLCEIQYTCLCLGRCARVCVCTVHYAWLCVCVTLAHSRWNVFVLHFDIEIATS